MGWQTTESVDEFLNAAGDFLRARPVENTMPLSISREMQTRGRHAFGDGDPIFGWFTGDHGTVDGVFLQTPPHPLLIGAAPGHTAPALAEMLAARPLPAVNGRTADAEAFAARWLELTGSTARVAMRTRLFRLATLLPPPAPAGGPRVAGRTDRDLLIDWFDAFHREVHAGPARNNAALVDDKISYGGITVWEVDGEIVALAGVTRQEAGAVRVAPVYTPPAQRGRGYGAAVTAAVTRAALDAGADDVVLFTDITNPTSNALYERLGYRPIEDRTVLEFSA